MEFLISVHQSGHYAWLGQSSKAAWKELKITIKCKNVRSEGPLVLMEYIVHVQVMVPTGGWEGFSTSSTQVCIKESWPQTPHCAKSMCNVILKLNGWRKYMCIQELAGGLWGVAAVWYQFITNNNSHAGCQCFGPAAITAARLGSFVKERKPGRGQCLFKHRGAPRRSLVPLIGLTLLQFLLRLPRFAFLIGLASLRLSQLQAAIAERN